MVAVTSSRAIPTREQGYAVSTPGNGFWSNLSDERTPELQWPASIDVFDRMRKQDAQVGSVLRAVKQPLQTPIPDPLDPDAPPRPRWRLDATGCRDEVALHVSQDLGLPIIGRDDLTGRPLRRRGRFSWAEHLRLALLHLDFGHMVFEQEYRIDDAGMAHLHKLGPRFPRSIAEWNVASDGGLVSVRQHAAAGTLGSSRNLPRPMPVNRLVVYANEREGGNWQGQSLLRTAYKAWLLKDDALRTHAQTIERNGMGVPVYTAAESEEDLTAGQKIASSFRSGAAAGAALRNGSTLELKGVDGKLADGLGFIKYLDEQIARAVLAHFLNLGTQTGSWALGTTFADFFTMSINGIGAFMAEVGTGHVVEDIVDINWGQDEPAPVIVYSPIVTREPAMAESVAAAEKVIGPDVADDLADQLASGRTAA